MSHNSSQQPQNVNTEFATAEDLSKAKERIDFLLTGVIVVLIIGFVTLLITVSGLMLDAERFKAETYQNLVNKISDQNLLINKLVIQLDKKNKY